MFYQLACQKNRRSLYFHSIDLTTSRQQSLNLISCSSSIWASGLPLTSIPHISIIPDPARKSTSGVISKLAKYLLQHSKTQSLLPH